MVFLAHNKRITPEERVFLINNDNLYAPRSLCNAQKRCFALFDFYNEKSSHFFISIENMSF